MLFGSRIIIATSTMSSCITQATGSSIGLLKSMASSHTPVSGKRANIQRIYCNNSLDALYKDLYAYSAHCADYDFKAVHQYKKEAAINYSTKLYKNDSYYQVAYTNCPGTTGFNLIPLNVPASGKVSATLEGLAPGSALAVADPGTVVD